MGSWAERWRVDFPALNTKRGRKVSYLDSACMSLVPVPVIAAMDEYYREYPGCGGRSVHKWSTMVTEKVGAARERFGTYFGAQPSSLVNTRNTTEAINMVARGIGLRRGSKVLLSNMEHNSNLVVWQLLEEQAGIKVRFFDLPSDRAFDVDTFSRALSDGVELVSTFHSSNMDGRTLPAKEIIELAHDAGARVLLDGSQSAPHHRVDLEALDVDYYALSFHKMLGPTGTGLLYCRPELMPSLSPLISGGETVEWTDYHSHSFLRGPERFEAGLQNYAGIIGAERAVSYLMKVELSGLNAHERRLRKILDGALSGSGIDVIGVTDPKECGSIFAFNVPGFNPHDVAIFLDEAYQVMVRSGMNCVHSWYRNNSLPDGNVRASFYLYNTERDVELLVSGIKELVKIPRKRSKGSRGSSPSRRRSRDP